MENRYFVEMSDGSRFGPADLATLKEWVAQGRVQPSTTLVSETTDERLRADALEGLFGTGATEPPPVVTPGIPPSGPAGGPSGMPPMAHAEPPRKNRSTLYIVLAVLGGFGCCVLLILAAILFPVFAQAKVAAGRTRGLSNIKQLSTGIMIYAVDHDDGLPLKMENARAFEPVVSKYVQDPLLFQSANPKGGEILGDKRLNGASLTGVASPMTTIMLHDSLPWTRGDVPVAYIDGHAKFVSHASIPLLMAPDPFGR